MAPSYISTRESICGSDLSIVVETVIKFVFSTSDKQVINSKHGVTLSLGASPTETSLSQSTAESQEKNFKLNSSLSCSCVSIQSPQRPEAAES